MDKIMFRTPPEFWTTLRDYDKTNRLVPITCPECERPSITCACMALYHVDNTYGHMCNNYQCACSVMTAVRNFHIEVCDCWLIEPKRYQNRCHMAECNMETDHQIDSNDLRCYPRNGPFGLKCITAGHDLKTHPKLGIEGKACRDKQYEFGKFWENTEGHRMKWMDADRRWYVYRQGVWFRSNWKQLALKS